MAYRPSEISWGSDGSHLSLAENTGNFGLVVLHLFCFIKLLWCAHTHQQILACKKKHITFNHVLIHNIIKLLVFMYNVMLCFLIHILKVCSLRFSLKPSSAQILSHRMCNIWCPEAVWPVRGLERGSSHPHTPGLSLPVGRQKSGRWMLRWRWRACRNPERSTAAWYIPSAPLSRAPYTPTTSFLQKTEVFWWSTQQ